MKIHKALLLLALPLVVLALQGCPSNNNNSTTPAPAPTATGTPSATPTTTATTTPTSTPCSGVFGNNASQPSIGGNTSAIFLTRIQASANTSLVSLSLQMSGGTTFQMGIYADSGGPGNLLADTGPQPGGTGLNTAKLSTPLSLTSGTYYWLAFHCDGNFNGQSGTYPLWIESTTTAFGPLPNPSGASDQSTTYSYQAFGTTCP